MSSFNPFNKIFRPSVPLSSETTASSAGFTAQPVSGSITPQRSASPTIGISAGIGVNPGAVDPAPSVVSGGIAGKTIGDVPLTNVVAGGTFGAPLAVGGAAAGGITNQFSGLSAGALSAGVLGTGASSGLRAAALSQIVQIGDQPVTPTIVRGGEEVTAPPLIAARVDDLVSRFVPILRIRIPRGVSQSIAPGTMVAKGTPIDVVLVPVSDIDFSLFQNAHDDLKAKTLDSVLPLLADPAVAPILQKANASLLTDADKATLAQKAGTIGVSVDDNVATKSTATLFDSLKNAKAFQ